ncbi:Transcription activator of gluconeogenesis [Spathaspora sp. JA1]|nr:Transcription activator of gluconeogenesis [Spathaspora sp. JA1]
MSSEEPSTVVENSPEPINKPRRKTTRACNHCHKAHMTCDSSRPCKRCIQRGLELTCEDAPRKRKKYLADVPNDSLVPSRMEQTISEIVQPPQTSNNNRITYEATMFQHSATVPTMIQQTPDSMNYTIPSNDFHTQPLFPQRHHLHQPGHFHRNGSTHQQQHVQPLFPQQQQPGQVVAPKKRTNFLSSAADLEYSTLSSILQDSFGHHPSTSNEGTPNSNNSALSPHNYLANNYSTTGSKISSPSEIQTIPTKIRPSHSNSSSPLNHPHEQSESRTTSIYDDSRYPKCDESINQYFIGRTESDHISLFPDVITAIENMKANDPALYFERHSKSSLSFSIGILPEDNHYNKQSNGNNGSNSEDWVLFKEPEEIYDKVKKPFSYTPGYHLLIAYLRKRFSKPMLVEMAEAMAAYRPSFIACTNSLKEHDLIFMEQCFQRTLLTYDNIIRISGTPTIVWRRTGEIAYVGNEFCILTGWTRQELVGGKQKKFIVELLDDKSVVEYFHIFSHIAFGDFLGATMTECTLLTPNKDVKIRAGCMWTLKRDVFGIPMMIVGNFLPII